MKKLETLDTVTHTHTHTHTHISFKKIIYNFVFNNVNNNDYTN